jgi:hypothetical protein
MSEMINLPKLVTLPLWNSEAGAGFLIAFAAGYWIHHKHKNKKISKVPSQ